jgi:hypothetical protein
MSWLVSLWKLLLPTVAPISVGRRGPSAAQPGHGLRARRGLLMTLPLAWRRCALGSNHIASHGVWRAGRRRAVAQPNAKGETRWHLCRRLTPSFPFSGQPQQGARA